jgi:D-beta-D-heptose 7-phosphate kinase/D-beta-D-heptose 1-phosphate adenosyltransferase
MAYNVYNNLVNLGARVDIITEYRERKHRYVDDKTGQQLLRVDEKIRTEHIDTADKKLLSLYDAIVVSDYNKGFVAEGDIKDIRAKYNGPIFVDTKKTNLAQFDGCFVKINQYELEAAETLTDELIVTYGSKKVEYKNRTYLPPSVETHDVCGAGDTFLAGLVFKYLESYDMDAAIKFAMQAAAVTVQHRGVYAPTLNEVVNET